MSINGMDFHIASGKCLLVGEENFSFAYALAQKIKTHHYMVASCPQTSIPDTKYVDLLKQLGHQVHFGIDATNLKASPEIAQETFSTVIFNFPHAHGKNNIKRNRKLLLDFFISAQSVLTDDGCILTTLCAGQGGIPIDCVQRPYNDTWQIVALAADAGLILTTACPFSADHYDHYQPSGYRGQGKSFCTDGAMSYVFKRGKEIKILPILKERAIQIPPQDFLTSLRSILDNDQHPIMLIKNKLMQHLYDQSAEHTTQPDCVNPYIIWEGTSRVNWTKETNSEAIEKNIPLDRFNYCNCKEHVNTTARVPLWGFPKAFTDFESIKRKIEQNGSSNSLIGFGWYHTNLPCTAHPQLRSELTGFSDLDSRQTGEILCTLFQEVFVNVHCKLDISNEPKLFGSMEPCATISTANNNEQKKDVVQLYSWDHTNKGTIYSIDLLKLCLICAQITDWRTLLIPDIQGNLEGNRMLISGTLSLYPPTYKHDISFWADATFCQDKFIALIHDMLYMLISDVYLLEIYKHETSEKTSYCYRMTYQSCDKPLSKHNCNQLQINFREQLKIMFPQITLR